MPILHLLFTGWTENMAIKNGAHRWVIEAMTQLENRLPFPSWV